MKRLAESLNDPLWRVLPPPGLNFSALLRCLTIEQLPPTQTATARPRRQPS